ncbi:BatE protein, partial [Candidatus Saccharibacteria bacterium]|nr:BatE protein [Candidatus Saccharibacteria bacterium]
MNTIKKIFFLLISAMAFSVASTPTCAGIAAGEKAYNEGDFERAVDEWRTCADNGIENSDLYYNLGNAYFRG